MHFLGHPLTLSKPFLYCWDLSCLQKKRRDRSQYHLELRLGPLGEKRRGHHCPLQCWEMGDNALARRSCRTQEPPNLQVQQDLTRLFPHQNFDLIRTRAHGPTWSHVSQTSADRISLFANFERQGNSDFMCWNFGQELPPNKVCEDQLSNATSKPQQGKCVWGLGKLCSYDPLRK